jgi:hypothetical protein
MDDLIGRSGRLLESLLLALVLQQAKEVLLSLTVRRSALQTIIIIICIK